MQKVEEDKAEVRKCFSELDGRYLSVAFALSLIIATISTAVARIGRIILGNQVPASDFRVAWKPIADAVRNGAPLYLQGTGDNKPPLFHLLNLFLSGFDAYFAVFILIIGLVNGVSAILLWRLLGKYGRIGTGMTASVLFVFSLPVIKAHYIQSGSFAVLFILSSLIVRRGLLSGILVALAGLFYQYAVLLVPFVLWVQIRDREREAQIYWGASYLIGGVITLATVFILIAIIYSPRAALAGLYWSYGLPTGVTSEPIADFIHPPGSYAARLWIITDTIRWAKLGFLQFRYLFPLLIPAIFATYIEFIDKNTDFGAKMVFLMIGGGLPLLFRTWADYSLLLLPFLCA
ncbi:MAG: hypothetical protein ABEI86_06795, partial [Halobacteriaceae archaeon]